MVAADRVSEIREAIENQEKHLQELREQLWKALRDQQSSPDRTLSTVPKTTNAERIIVQASIGDSVHTESVEGLAPQPTLPAWPLTHDEYSRYGRQLIMPEIGLQGQLQLRNASVLIVGAGGLGCPAAAYLAGAGVGHLGIVDADTVEESNLHRQILHSTTKVGMSKVDSAIETLKALNPLVSYTAHKERLTPEIAFTTMENYDLVLDCTDTPASRYLISDTCVLLQKPLVSASALKTEGQLMVLNNPARSPGDTSGGPCYRCVFPRPPPADSVLSCGEGGILGPVVGVMGVLQALEAIKVLTSKDNEASEQPATSSSAEAPKSHALTLFSAYSSPQFRTMRLRGRKVNCAACSAQATVSRETIESGSLDYVQFCGLQNPVQILSSQERISATQIVEKQDAFLLIDVREKVQFDLCNISGSVNVPFSVFTVLSREDFEGSPKAVALVDKVRGLREASQKSDICVLCRHGNDSQVVVRQLKRVGIGGDTDEWIGDMEGGLEAWRREVDNEFPVY